MRELVEPVLRGMRAEGTGVPRLLYCGLMMTCAGPKVIEYNVRFGDPEAQAVMPLIDGELAAAAAPRGGRRSLRPARDVRDGGLGRRRARGGRLSRTGDGGAPISGLDRGVALETSPIFTPARRTRRRHRHRRRPRAHRRRDRPRLPRRDRSRVRSGVA
jgi:phosphoribosylamine--glycine ligase